MPFGRPLDGRKPAGGVTVFPLSDELMIAETGVVDRLLLVEGRVEQKIRLHKICSTRR